MTILLRRHTVASPDGYGRLDFDDGKRQEFDVVICGHCDAEFHIVPGSGRKRGFCRHCGGVVCGAPDCMTHCTPLEERIRG